jgi:hypothetical protein
MASSNGSLAIVTKVSKIRPVIAHEGSEGKFRYSSTLVSNKPKAKHRTNALSEHIRKKDKYKGALVLLKSSTWNSNRYAISTTFIVVLLLGWGKT